MSQTTEIPPSLRSSAAPAGYNTLQPYIIVSNAAEAMRFYARAFGATERMCMKSPEGKVIHAELQFGDSVLMLADEHPEIGACAPPHFGGSPVNLMIYVENCDAAYRQALEAGAVSVREPADQNYGDRMSGVLDPFGYKWWIAHPLPKGDLVETAP